MSIRPCTLPGRLGITNARGKTNLSLSGPLIKVKEGIFLKDANDWGALTGLAQSASTYLSRVRGACASSPVSLSEAARDEALESLRSMGQMLMSRILGRYRSMTQALGPGNLECGPDNPPIVDIEIFCSDDLVLPAETLPLLEPFDPKRPASDPLLQAAAMLGFGGACHRPTTTPRPFSDEARLDPRAVRFYWHADLEGARKQWKWFCKRIDGRGPHPEKGEDRKALVNWIVFKEGGPREVTLTSAVEHFHCHHERRGDDRSAREDVMRLRARGWTWHTREVKVSADQVAGKAYRQPPAAGLVFLNACSSQLVSPRAVSSFAREFLLNGRNAVVTTWSDVPDDVAFCIGRFFYEAFLRGETVGTALREARVRLLLEKNNPLGLLYTVYGDSHFRLAGVRN